MKVGQALELICLFAGNKNVMPVIPQTISIQ